MTPEERAELDRLLDIAEREELLARAPDPDTRVVLEYREALFAGTVAVEAEELRRARARLADAAEWVD